MNNRIIRKVGVIGSGIMGAQIACHFANIGVQAVLLDILPSSPTEEEEKKGLGMDHPFVRNRIARENLKKTKALNPNPLYSRSFASRIQTGNLEDHLAWLSDVDWLIEVVTERLDIKKEVFSRIEEVRKPGTLISSNTSGIPIHSMLEGRSDDFCAHFCGTHFFNPPRYLQLLEIIPTEKTAPEVVDFLMHYGDLFLGKTTVLAKDTPAFIANRIGVFSIMALFQYMETADLSIDEVDKLTGPLIGRPKSATFRTSDLVGLDTLVHVAKGLQHACPEDERRSVFQLPGFVEQMVGEGRLGSKTGAGFYKKIKDEDGKRKILSLDLKTGAYGAAQKRKFATLEQTRSIESVADRLPVLIGGSDAAAAFYRAQLGQLFAYTSHRVPEISDEIYRIDDALRAGFGWEHGPFELWDAIGLKKGIELAAQSGHQVSQWVLDLAEEDKGRFYKTENGQRLCLNPNTKAHHPVASDTGRIVLNQIREGSTVWKNKECSLIDLGDGILNFEVHSKMNTLGGAVLSGLNKAFDLAESSYKGLVIGNQGAQFSAGANLAMIFMLATEGEWEELDFAVRYFQKSVMRVRYSGIPVVVAPHGLSLGGGCEMSLHADAVQAAAETYTGLVEVGVGLIPGGGGTKEMTKRASERYVKDDVELNALREYYLTIGMAKVATSAHEAFELGLFQNGKDQISVSKQRQITDAKQKVLLLADLGYSPPVGKTIKVLGRQALGMFEAGAHAMQEGGYISEHDRLISSKLAYIMSGGDLSEATEVSEQYLLDLEREAFLSLCGERKTLERIQHMLKTGKPLRN